MIVDNSAMLAIVLHEPEGERFARAIIAERGVSISAGSWLAIGAVLTRRFRGALDADFDRIAVTLQVDIAPVTVEQAAIARDAYRRYGIGTGHPARLTSGDCFAYALSRASGRALLFRGDGFAQTDIVAALR